MLDQKVHWCPGDNIYDICESFATGLYRCDICDNVSPEVVKADFLKAVRKAVSKRLIRL